MKYREYPFWVRASRQGDCYTSERDDMQSFVSQTKGLETLLIHNNISMWLLKMAAQKGSMYFTTVNLHFFPFSEISS